MSKENEPKVIAETPQWLAIEKPSGWLTIAGRTTAPIVQSWLNERYERVWVVHRLDLETSGILLFARNRESHRVANEWFAKREIKKYYICIAQNSAIAPMFKIHKEINSQKALTQVEVLENYKEAFVGSVRLVTGRRHQIRIHLAHEGHPLLGDVRYGGVRTLNIKDAVLDLKRVALHARRIELPNGELFESPISEDIKGWINVLRDKGEAVGI